MFGNDPQDVMHTSETSINLNPDNKKSRSFYYFSEIFTFLFTFVVLRAPDTFKAKRSRGSQGYGVLGGGDAV